MSTTRIRKFQKVPESSWSMEIRTSCGGHLVPPQKVPARFCLGELSGWNFLNQARAGIPKMAESSRKFSIRRLWQASTLQARHDAASNQPLAPSPGAAGHIRGREPSMGRSQRRPRSGGG